MNEAIRLNIIAGADRYPDLHHQLAQVPFVEVCKSYADAVSASGGLDAVFISLMSAKEWGAVSLNPPVHMTRVISMPPWEIAHLLLPQTLSCKHHCKRSATLTKAVIPRY